MTQSDDAAPEHASTWRYALVVGAAAGFITGVLDVGTFIVAPSRASELVVPTSLMVSAAAGVVASWSTWRIGSGAVAGGASGAVATPGDILAFLAILIGRALLHVQPAQQPGSGEAGLAGLAVFFLVLPFIAISFVSLAALRMLGGVIFGATAAAFFRWLGERRSTAELLPDRNQMS